MPGLPQCFALAYKDVATLAIVKASSFPEGVDHFSKKAVIEGQKDTIFLREGLDKIAKVWAINHELVHLKYPFLTEFQVRQFLVRMVEKLKNTTRL